MKKKIKKLSQKTFSLFLLFSITFSSIFIVPIKVNAEQTHVGVVSGNDVFFRSKPTTVAENGVSNVITSLDAGDVVTVLSTNKIAGKKNDCEAGWYQVSYQNITGYMCSTYVSVSGYDIYDRPWTSPKKAIVGGAKFIANSYISRGQFTSYLKKYNVNPNSYYQVYNHLYMANIQAPSSEAKSSYSTYTKNGLFNLPLEFNIPIYNNMKDSYNRPGGNLTTVEKQNNVTDQAFEQALINAGFPDSYRPALRALHTKHPNWTFTAMNTGLDFNASVEMFKLTGAIQGGNQYYEMSNGVPKQYYNDKNWYFPNYDTTAYFLDPRNFLTESYILQFESLKNSDNYTESIVSGVLKNTFMDGYSVLDNQTYASIFVEAGKVANVSSVYLASLARQESGVNGSGATTGAQFEYEGKTYGGLFNFFNIGASSGASNPLRAGLVYASGGLCTVCSANEVYTQSVALSNAASLSGYQVSNGYIYGFSLGESMNSFKEKLSGLDISTSSGTIGTGTKVSYGNESYTIIIYGDLSGDGQINSADLLKMRQHLLGTSTLTGAYKEAAYLSGDNSINSADLLKMRQYLLGTGTISQR